jgi:oligopeptide/dipeptide ABC transporter ATP-binding protein
MVKPGPPLLDLQDITVSFPGIRRSERSVVLHGVSLSLEKGVTVGLVGESGCGKTTLGRAAVGLQKIDNGKICYDGTDITRLQGNALRTARRRIQMVFQNPFASLNPRMTVFDAIAEAVQAGSDAHQLKTVLTDRISSILEQVGLDAAMMRKFPHEFSGGQRQRIAIARALAVNPSVIIADEPVSSLDVSVAAQILNLLHGLRERLGLTMLFVSHDLSVVRFIARYIAVMYRGRVVEYGQAESIFTTPRHPYTAMLLQAVPVISTEPGAVPFFERVPAGEAAGAAAQQQGCPFAPRCQYKHDECLKVEPVLEPVRGDDNRLCACLRAGELRLT